MRRVSKGLEAKAGVGERLRNRFNNTMEAANRGSELLSNSFDKTKESLYKGAGSLQNAYETIRKPGSTRGEMFSSLAAAGRDIYGFRKDYMQTRRDLGNVTRDLKARFTGWM